MTWPDDRMAIPTLCSSVAEEAPEELVTVSKPSWIPSVPVCNASGRTLQPRRVAKTRATGSERTKQRSRRLSNSERGKLYRSRRKDYVQTLEEQVHQLNKEVGQLMLHARAQQLPQPQLGVTRWHPIGASFGDAVNEYFSLFKYGVPVTDNPNAPQDQLLLSTRQVAYLKGLMHPQMVFASSYGVRELLRQWMRYPQYYANFKCEVKTVQVMVQDPNPVVVVPTTLSVRFTRRTIKEIFPHLLWNEPLVQRLIGQELQYSVKNTFYFGDDSKIYRYDSYVDFAEAFVRLVGNSHDALMMMERAHIQQACIIGAPQVRVEETSTVEPTREFGSHCNSRNLRDHAMPVGARIGMSIQGIL